jgi:biopolymer transport protein ExbB
MNSLAFVAFLLASWQEPSAQDRLKRAVEDARRELSAEEERIAKEDAAEEAELARTKDKLSKLTDELVDRTGSISLKTKEQEALRLERGKLKQARTTAVQTWIELHRTASDMRQKLSDLVDSLPPSESRAAQKKMLEDSKVALEHPAGEPFDLGPLLVAGRSLLSEAGTTAAFTQPIRNSEGLEEEARVLRAGMIFHAYQGKKSGKVGEVAAAPSGLGGYRWTESLPDWAKRDLLLALDQASGSAPASALHLPLDVTQRLAPERRDSSRSFVETLWAGGPVMVPLLGVGLLAVLVTLERLVTLTAKSAGSGREVAAILDSCRKGDFASAARIAEAGKGLRMKALAAALAARGSDRVQVEEAVRQTVLRQMPSLERSLSLLAVLAGIAPMLGLLGTVTGMIRTFDIIRLFGSGDPGIMAGGISEALVATATGLVIAIPILLIHSFVTGRVDRILADAQVHVAALLPLLGEPESQEVTRG